MSRTKCQSIYDLAERTGVSASTVSRVLNRRGHIAEQTRQRVLAAARAHGFRPRTSLRQMTIAVVIDRVQYATYGGFVSVLLAHLVAELARHDLAVEIYTESNVQNLSNRLVDGILAMTWDQGTLDQLHRIDAPVVMLNRMDSEATFAVASDHQQSGELVGRYLIERGHRRIAFIAEESDWGALARIEGLQNAMAEAGLDPSSLSTGFTQHQPVYRALHRLLADEPTALFVGCEDLGLEVPFILTEVRGMKIPDDLSVVALDNAKILQFTHPPLTAVCQPLDAIAAEAVKILQELAELEDGAHHDGRSRLSRQVLLPNLMIERESVATIAKEKD